MNPAPYTPGAPAGSDSLWAFPPPSSSTLPTSAHFSQPTPQPPTLESYKLQLESQKAQLELARETIRLRELELQIALERRREREVELELVKWKAGQGEMCRQGTGVPPGVTLSTFGPPTTTRPSSSSSAPFPSQPTFSDPSLMNLNLSNMNALGLQPFLPFPPSSGDPETAAFDSILRELLLNDPSYLSGPGGEVALGYAGGGAAGAGEGGGAGEEEESQDDIEPMSRSGTSGVHSPSGLVLGTEDSSPHLDPPSISASASNSVDSPAPAPPPATSRRSKKQVLTSLALCTHCSTPIAKLFLRGTPSELSDEFTLHYLCSACASPVPSSASGRARKRVKQTEDCSLPTVCDVCLRGRGRGGIVPRAGGRGVRFAVEVVCLPCTEKYKRCSDCGGGSGRLGVGKWRCKELFYEGRKTCNLSHARLGTGELELAVWDVPKDVREEDKVQQVLDACETLWRDNVLRLAVPEILDSDQDSPLGLRTYRDIQTKILDRGWPAREHIMREAGEGRKKYLALTWAKTRPRRAKGVKESSREVDKKDENYLFGNIKRTKIFYPAGCILVGMWICNWDIDRRSIHMSTTSPFDARDFEDQSIVSIAETFSRIVTDGMSTAASPTTSSLVPPSHWWMTYDVICPVVLSRLEDVLIKRKRCFPLYEYIQRYDDVQEKDFVEPTYTRVVDPETWAAAVQAKVEGGTPHGQTHMTEPVVAVAKFLGISGTWLRMQKINQKIYDKRIAAVQAKKRKASDDKPAGSGGGGDDAAAEGGVVAKRPPRFSCFSEPGPSAEK